MTSYTTLVNVDEEAASKLVQFISLLLDEGANDFYEECQMFIDGLKKEELISKLMEKKNLIFGMENENDIEGCFQAMFSIIYLFGEDFTESTKIIRSITSTLVKDKETYTKASLKVLIILFNLTFSEEAKYDVLCAIFHFAIETNQGNQVTQFYPKLKSWCKEWNLSSDRQRNLYSLMTSLLFENDEKKTALSCLISLFQTFSEVEGPLKLSEKDENLISYLLVFAIKSNINDFATRNSLSQIAESLTLPSDLSKLTSLLKIICDGSVSDFDSFNSANNAIFEKFDLNAANLRHSVQLLTLSTLASQSATLTFDFVRKELNIADDEVELYVIEAIDQGLLDASMDQLQGSITVHRFEHRSFGIPQWQILQQKLRMLRSKVGQVAQRVGTETKKISQ